MRNKKFTAEIIKLGFEMIQVNHVCLRGENLV